MSAQGEEAPLIVATALSKAFGYRPVLRGLDFGIKRGTTVALLGRNGSGKTTLLRILAALSKPSAGTLTVGGWTLPKEATAIRAQLGVVAHLPLLYDDMTAEENLRFFARLYAVDQSDGRIQAGLARVGLGKRGRDLVRTFSRGMQQRLALARALLHDPAVLLLDEPYTGLDVSGAQMLDSLFAEWKAARRTVITALHEPARAAALCDYALILSGGKLVVDAPMPALPDLVSLLNSATPNDVP